MQIAYLINSSPRRMSFINTLINTIQLEKTVILRVEDDKRQMTTRMIYSTKSGIKKLTALLRPLAVFISTVQEIPSASK